LRTSGQILAGKYRLVRELGKGGMGAVWCAEHIELRSPVALKLIESGSPSNAQNARQFLHEARLAAALQSPNVVRIFDYGVAEDTPFIAMELLEGETLRQRLERQGRLGLTEAQKIMRQVCRGVERAHRAQVIHRDLKPENVFISEGGDHEIIKVLDFGLAKSQSALADSISSATPTGALLGTPHYMSPEQARGAKGLDHRTDLWSLGVIAFECLLGSVPFRGDTLGDLIVALCSEPLPVPSRRGAVPPGFDAWFARACAREPARRFASASELAGAFDALAAVTEPSSGAREPPHATGALEEPTLAAPSIGAVASAASGKPRSLRRWRLVGALIALALLAGGLVSVWKTPRPEQHDTSAATLMPAPPIHPAPPSELAPAAPAGLPASPPDPAPASARPAAEAPPARDPPARADSTPKKKLRRPTPVDLGF